jgi:hypothetical protein
MDDRRIDLDTFLNKLQVARGNKSKTDAQEPEMYIKIFKNFGGPPKNSPGNNSKFGPI